MRSGKTHLNLGWTRQRQPLRIGAVMCSFINFVLEPWRNWYTAVE